jgi:hypothetical protein
VDNDEITHGGSRGDVSFKTQYRGNQGQIRGVCGVILWCDFMPNVVKDVKFVV